MMDGYIPTHETTFIEASKVSRFVPRGIPTNVLMAQEKLKIGHSAYYGLMCSEWTFENCWLALQDSRMRLAGKAGRVRRGLWFIWSFRFVLFIWLVSFNQTNQTDRIDQMNKAG